MIRKFKANFGQILNELRRNASAADYYIKAAGYREETRRIVKTSRME
ncbi:MAG: hypothetical protein ACFE7E_02435 [Candidatus Hodarchaeota archaeon]